MRDILWTSLAKNSLQECLDFMVSNWGDQSKDDLFDTIDKRLEQVCINPKIAPVLSETEFRRLLIHKNLTIFYVVQPSTIKVVLAWDNRQNPESLEKKLIE